MRVRVAIVNAFIDGMAGGNPAGVVLDAEALNERQKLQVASQVALSETAFVSHSEAADFKLDFFTPVRRIPDCGHATVAAFTCLREQGRIARPDSSKEIVDGVRRVFAGDDGIFMDQALPRYIRVEHARDAILRSLHLDDADLAQHELLAVDTGNPFLLMPLAGQRAMKKALPDFGAIHAVSDALGLCGYYLFTTETQGEGRHAATRMFAPRFGIREEAATGTAAGALACYLRTAAGLRDTRLRLEQGHFMQPPSPSLLNVELEIAGNGDIGRVRVGGNGKTMHVVHLEID